MAAGKDLARPLLSPGHKQLAQDELGQDDYALAEGPTQRAVASMEPVTASGEIALLHREKGDAYDGATCAV
jgi:hypothetical protein